MFQLFSAIHRTMIMLICFFVCINLVSAGKITASSTGKSASKGIKYWHGISTPQFPDSLLPLVLPAVDKSIMQWDNVLSSSECVKLIALFEASQEAHYEGAVMVDGLRTIDAVIKKNTEISITDEAESTFRWHAVNEKLEKLVQMHLHLYQEENIILSTQQNPFSDEGFRMKRYLRTVVGMEAEHHSYHSDSGHEKAANPHRILAVLLYLNDVDEGGETLFLNQGVSITPKAGRLVFFPTAFTFVHAGRAPRSGSKYVVINFLTT